MGGGALAAAFFLALALDDIGDEDRCRREEDEWKDAEGRLGRFGRRDARDAEEGSDEADLEEMMVHRPQRVRRNMLRRTGTQVVVESNLSSVISRLSHDRQFPLGTRSDIRQVLGLDIDLIEACLS